MKLTLTIIIAIVAMIGFSNCRIKNVVIAEKQIQGEWNCSRIVSDLPFTVNQNVRLDTIIFNDFINKKSVLFLNGGKTKVGKFRFLSNKKLLIKWLDESAKSNKLILNYQIINSDTLILHYPITTPRGRFYIKLFCNRNLESKLLTR